MLSLQNVSLEIISELKARLSEFGRVLGMHVSTDGSEVLHTSCAEFDYHRAQNSAFVPQPEQEEPSKFSFVSSTLTEGFDLITQPVEYAPFKRRVVGSNPTGVSYRLIVQRRERLASNELVLGSNPSKAVSPSLAQQKERAAANAGRRRFKPA